MNFTMTVLNRRISLVGFVFMILLCVGTPNAESVSCIEMVPGTMFDTSDYCPSQPSYDRVFGSQIFTWGDSSYLMTNIGNELKIWNIDDQLNPVEVDESTFRVGNVGDSDYDLENFSVCDECRFGVANYKRGIVLFDLGEAEEPQFANEAVKEQSPNVPGAFTFLRDDQQYLIAATLIDECASLSSTLYTFDGIDEATGLTSLGCVEAEGDSQTQIVGGIAVGDYLYLGDKSQRVFLFQIHDAGSVISLEYLETPMTAYMIRDKGLAFDAENGVAIEANHSGMHVWDISNPGAPIEMGAVDGDFNRATVAYPFVMVARKGIGGSEMTFDISNFSEPTPLDPEFWDAENEWNNPDSVCSEIQGAVFSPDGSALYLARQAVMQIAKFATCAAAPEAYFSYAPMPAIAAEPVQFRDASLNGPTSWIWDFGDGQTSTERNPVHTYSAVGTFTVSLMVTNAYGEGTVSDDVVVAEAPVSTETMVFFPAAAAVQGAEDSFWSTDVEINNRTGGPLAYKILLLERGADNEDPQSSGPFRLGVNQSARYENIVGDLFGFEGAGALAFVFSDRVDAILTSRTFNTLSESGTEGTFGQAIPSVSEDELIPENTKVRLIQLSQDEEFRSNIGFMNATVENIRINVDFFLADGTYLGGDFQDLASFSNLQWNNAFARVTTDDVPDGWVEVWTETPGGLFTVYASVIGNDDFNDPTTVTPQ